MKTETALRSVRHPRGPKKKQSLEPWPAPFPASNPLIALFSTKSKKIDEPIPCPPTLKESSFHRGKIAFVPRPKAIAKDQKDILVVMSWAGD
jgi:hypothetical protein